MPFVNSYAFRGLSLFRTIVPASENDKPDLAAGHLAIGSDVGSGLAALIGSDGTVIWSRRYTIAGRPLDFIDGAAASGDGFALLSAAARPGVKDLQQYILVRIDSAGNVLWAKQIYSGQTLSAVRLVRTRTPADEFHLFGRTVATVTGQSGSGIELIRLAADGTILRSARLQTGSDDNLFDVIALSDGFILVGDSVLAQERGGLVIYIDRKLNLRSAWLINATNKGFSVSLRSAAVSSNGFVVTGRSSPDGLMQSSMVAVLRIESDALFTLVRSFAYGVHDGQDQPAKIATFGNDFLLLDVPDVIRGPQTILRLNADILPKALYSFNLADGSKLHSLRVSGNETVLIPGAIPSPRDGDALLLGVDDTFACCKTKLLRIPAFGPIKMTIRHIDASVTDTKASSGDGKIVATKDDPTIKQLCDTTAIVLHSDTLLQSPYLNLQAAGSMGDDASRGILLRWFLSGALSTHLPKGSLAKSTINFNKPDDFVTVYRAPWPGSGLPTRRLSFASDKPINVDNTERALIFEAGTRTPRDLFVVRFANPSAYFAAGQAVNPMVDPAGFLSAYGANPIEIELRNVLAVACDLEYQPNATSTVQVETLSVGENRPLASKYVTSRRVLSASSGPTVRLFAENMRSVRLVCTGTQLMSVSFLCYEDVLIQVNQSSGWSQIGKFALTLDQSLAFRRLEDPAHFQVHGVWRKFNDGAFVNINNYKARWLSVPDGLAAAVQQYVQLSDSDSTATAPLAGATSGDGSMSASYLDLLNLAAVDYHVARIFGLAHVDNDGIDQTMPYIYVAEYTTLGDLGDGKGARQLQHLYTSLPTTLGDARLPLVPDLNPIEYGLTVPTGNGTPVWLTDQQGYTPDGLTRYIRLFPDCEPLYEEEQGFFVPPVAFDLAASSLPVLYGVEYRKQAESGWRNPEIGHDPDYFDTAASPVAEAVPTPFPANRRESAFIHKEIEPGVHEYALYSINIFSRVSSLSPMQATDATEFRRANRMLPPSDLQVQIIQKESPLVLTTNSEQALLENLLKLPDDPTLVRLSFNYAHAQDANYDFADVVEIFFRPQLPANVIGGVKTSGPASDPSLIKIETQSYTYVSTLETVDPVITVAQRPNFLGGALVVGGRRFIIEDIDWPNSSNGKDPIFFVRKPTTTGVLNAAGSNTLVIEDVAVQTNPGDLLMAVENMAAASSWGSNNPLSTTIAIGDSSWTMRTENFTRPDNSQVSRKLRGVWQTAQIDPVLNEPNHYEITFDSYVLTPHPQSSATDPVNWHKGIVRVSVAGRNAEDRRALTVLQVHQTTAGKLQLLAVDDSGEPGAVLANPNTLIIVNYYPGYKIYLHADPAHGFDSSALMPGQGEGSRATLIGLRAVDTTTIDVLNQPNPYRSPLGVPQPLIAVEIIEPKIPYQPLGLKYATPPDAYGKSSYTLTVNFRQRPFAAVFYRADAFSILRAIYGAETFDALRAALLPPEKPYFAERFNDLLEFADTGNGVTEFASFPLDGDPYSLPHPDSAAFSADAGTPLVDLKSKIKTEIMKVFLPLTGQPLIYDFISQDPTYVPTNKKQIFRDANGDLLTPGLPPFNLAPMAKRSDTNGTHTIQFADFTIEGSMNPNTVYFYFAREMGNRMQLGEASPIFGPVKLVNLSPPSAPKLRKIATVPYDALTGHNPEVRFEVVVPSGTDPITRMHIYRASSALDALILRAMTRVKEINTLVPTADGTFIVADDFSNDSVVPFGEPLFYRLAWIRDVTYKDANDAPQNAVVISEPTQTLLANLIDVVNPTAPVPTLNLLSTTVTGDKLLRISWSKVVHNGTYYVSRLDPSGNWVRLTALKTNDALVTFDLPDALPVDDEDGNRIYYRFKVDVENSSGLLNQTDSPITASLESI